MGANYPPPPPPIHPLSLLSPPSSHPLPIPYPPPNAPSLPPHAANRRYDEAAELLDEAMHGIERALEDMGGESASDETEKERVAMAINRCECFWVG